MRPQALVTGATGLVGHAVTDALVRLGTRPRVLVRRPDAARALFGDAVDVVVGDVTDPASTADAVRGVDVVFHAAGMPEQWAADPEVFDRVNRGGTEVVLRAALAAGVRRVVYTSTMDVFAAPPGGTLVETSLDEAPKPTAYERSKVAADRVAARLAGEGLDVVHVNPAAVYGISPVVTGANRVIADLVGGRVPALPPGGMPLVEVRGVASAHLAAAERGRPGERYLVADGYASMAELAAIVCGAVGRRPPRTAPLVALRALAAISDVGGRALGIRPLVADSELTFLQWQVRVDARRAMAELGFTPTPLTDGLAAAARYFAR